MAAELERGRVALAREATRQRQRKGQQASREREIKAEREVSDLAHSVPGRCPRGWWWSIRSYSPLSVF